MEAKHTAAKNMIKIKAKKCINFLPFLFIETVMVIFGDISNGMIPSC